MIPEECLDCCYRQMPMYPMMSGQMPGTMMGGMPGQMPETMMGGMPGQMPGTMMGGMPGQMPGPFMTNIPGQMPGTMPGTMMEGAEGQMPTGVTGAIEGMPGPAPGTTVQGVPGSTAVPPMGITGAGGTATTGMCGPAGCGSPFETAPGSPIQLDINYTQGYLRTQIGKLMRVEFLIGTSTSTDRTGVLVGVGISYILLRDVGSNNIIVCDIYSIKFVTIYATPR